MALFYAIMNDGATDSGVVEQEMIFSPDLLMKREKFIYILSYVYFCFQEMKYFIQILPAQDEVGLPGSQQ